VEWTTRCPCAAGARGNEREQPLTKLHNKARFLLRVPRTDNKLSVPPLEVAAVVDEDLGRFDPLIAYYARFAPDGDPARIDWERDAAHGVKRDLAWAAIERAIGEPSFFSGLRPWYDRGRLPVGWSGAYPAGHVLVI